ncbi:ABC-2 type transport system permease protein [Rhodococcus sp. SMB37]|uniref:ABC transporter permease n=1 Tax=Rhodococcus sp. SMB37 TaxID=2512213 RepID=UPI00105099FB|nr:ABC transporter permease [Rhodococcus sp. SMB37]TCN58511.1 ABC-2 type transport system permease protein [Rhodococcus sp. SMB37]
MSSLTMTYTRRNLAENIRTPTMFLTVALVPVGVMLFFVVPFIGQDAVAITSATATLVVFGVLMACVGYFSVAIAAQRESAWGRYLRTLPGGIAPQMLGYLLVGLVVVAAAIIPILLVAGLFTEASAPPPRVVLAAGALLIAVVTFTLLGMSMGYLMSMRVAVIANSIGFLPLAVAGGMFFDEADTPEIIEQIAPFVPTRGATDLVLVALTGKSVGPLSLVMLAVWIVVLAGLTIWGHRRDQIRRFD